MKARVSNLYKTEADWNKLKFKPLPGELIVYAADPDERNSYTRLKIGDGETPVEELPFFVENCVDEKLAEYQRANCSDAGDIVNYFPKNIK
jgi:hypothetical protein